MKKTIFALGILCACNDAPATAQIDNGYAVVDGGPDVVVVYKVWWSSTLFSTPVSPGVSSEPQRAVKNTDYAYALVARGWDPASTDPPTSLVVVRSQTPLSVDRPDNLHIVVSPKSFVGDCASASVLSQDDADFITQRIFPGDFAGFQYDASKCTLTPKPSEAGADAGTDAATD